MENNRGQSIFLSVVGIATLLVAIVGATFAYFSISVTGNETASSINVTTARVGGVTFDGTGAGIEAVNVYPGWSQEKTFTIAFDETQGTVDTNASIQYQIILKSTEVGLSSAASSKHDFVYSLEGTGTGAATNVTNEDMPTSTADVLLGTGTLTGTNAASKSHSYDFTVLLKESSTDQNELQGLSYRGIIQIVVATNQGLRTWDTTNNSGWVPYPAD